MTSVTYTEGVRWTVHGAVPPPLRSAKGQQDLGFGRIHPDLPRFIRSALEANGDRVYISFRVHGKRANGLTRKLRAAGEREGVSVTPVGRAADSGDVVYLFVREEVRRTR